MANLATINNNLLADSGIDPISVVTGAGTATQIAYWSSGSAITGENSLVWDATNDRMGVGVVTPAASIHIEGAGSTYSAPSVSNVPGIYIQNTNSASGTANTFLSLRTTGASGGDPILSWDIGGIIGWSAGIDNSDDDKFKIANYWAGLDSNTRLTIDGSGNVGIGTTAPNTLLEANRTIVFSNIDTYGQFVIKTTSGANGKLLNFGVDEANTLSFIQSLYRGIDVMNLVLQRYGGNVGIGVNPSYKLDVNGNVRIGSGTSSLALKITGDDNYIEFDNSGTYIKGGGNLTVSATSNLLLFTGASERMRITSGGNVLIGSTTNEAGSKLYVLNSITTDYSGTIGMRYNVSGQTNSYYKGMTGTALDNSTARGLHIFNYDADSNVGIQFWSNARPGSGTTPQVIITSSGNVGIGTTSPTSFLQIGTYASAGKYIDVATLPSVPSNYLLTLTPPSTTNYYGGGIGWSEGTNTAAAINAYDDGAGGALGLSIATGSNSAIAERIRISSTGAVRFNAYGSGSFTGTRAYDLSVDASGNIIEVPVGAGTITGSGTTNYIPKFTSSSAIGNSDLLTDGSGNLAIAQGNAPTQALNIYRAGSTQTVMAAGNSNTGLNGTYFGVDPNGNGIINTTGAFANIFSTNGSERMRITSGGSVGIGTTSPSYKLQVQGNAAFATNSGGLRIDSYDGNTAVMLPTVANGSVLISDDSGLLTRGTEFLNGGGVIIQSLSGFAPLDVKSNGSNLLYVTSSGSVGVGTTSPSYKLDVIGNIASNAGTNEAQVFVTNSTSQIYLFNSYAGNTFGIYDGTAGQHRMYYDRGSNFWAFFTGASERMRITSDGNIGVGTSSPNGSSVERTIVLASNTATYYITNAANTLRGIFALANATTEVFIGTQTNHEFHFRTNDTRRMTLKTTGQLQLNAYTSASSFTGTAAGVLAFDSSGNVITQSSTLYPTGSGTTNYVTKWTGSNAIGNGLLYDNGTNVGLGTTAPTTRLMIESSGASFTAPSINDVASLYIRNSNNGSTTAHSIITLRTLESGGGNPFISFDIENIRGYAMGIDNADDDKFKLNYGWNSLSSNTLMTVTYGGNVGIGTTSPATLLHLQQSSGPTIRLVRTSNRFDITGDNDFMELNARDASTYMIFKTADTERMRLTSGGYLGIGTSAPTRTLDVRSDVGVLIKGASSSTDATLSLVPASGGRQYDFRNYGSSFGIKDASADVIRMYFHYNGNTGIGTSNPINTGTTIETTGAAFSTTATKNSNMYGLTLVSTTNENTMSGVWFGSGGGSHWSGIAGSRSNYTVDWSTHLSFYTHVANTVNITDATEKMRITGDGNVGIGTISPDAIFHVARPNAGGVGGQVVIDNNAGSTLGNTAELSFLTDAGASGAGTRNARILAVNENAGNGAARMEFHTWNGSVSAERMRITSGGNVLVGTTADAGIKLQVVGGTVNNQIARFVTADYPSHSIGLGVEAIGTNWGAVIFQDDVRRFTVEENGGILVGSTYQSSNAPANGAIIEGNVGVGTTAPLAKLSIGSGSLSDSNVPAQMSTGGAGTGAYFGWNKNGSYGFLAGMSNGLDGWTAGVIRMITTDPLYFITNNNGIAMSINSSQQVSIGTTVADTKLSVNGDMNIKAISGGTSYKLYFGSEVTSGPGKCIFLENFYLKIQGHRNEGVRLQGVNASGVVQEFATFYGDSSGTGSSATIYPSGGSVSIGKGAPVSALDVNGRISLGGALYTNVAQTESGAGTLGSGYNFNLNNGSPVHQATGSMAGVWYNTGSIQWYTNSSQAANTAASERMRITSGGNVAIGNSTAVSTSLVGALTIWKTYGADGASVPSPTAQNYYNNQDGLYLFGRNSGLSIISANGEEGMIHFANASTIAYATLGTTSGTSSVGGDMYFKVGSNNERMRITSSGNIGIATSSPSVLLHLENSNSSYTSPANNNLPSIYVNNTNSSSSTAHAILALRTLGASGGDPFISFDINGIIGWSMGIDNSDSDKFKIANAWSALDSSTRFSMETGGNATFTGTLTANSFFESSDLRLKTLIEKEIDYSAIANIEARYYKKGDREELGYFAQDFESILPSSISKNDEGFLNLSYNQVHTAKIAALEAKIKQLESQLKNK